MAAIDWILNLAGLLLWLNWRSGRSGSAAAAGVSLAGTLRRAGPRRAGSGASLLYLVFLLGARTVFYWRIGGEGGLSLSLDLKAIVLPFRCDRYSLMLLYSFVSFSLFMGGFYAWLILISVLNAGSAETSAVGGFIRGELGWLRRWPPAIRWLLPMGISIALWLLAGPLLARPRMVPAAAFAKLGLQSLVLALSSLLIWRDLLIALFLVHLATSYVYVGNSEFLKFCGLTARNALRPLRKLPLRVGKIDFSPIAAIAIVVALSETAARWLPRLYERIH